MTKLNQYTDWKLEDIDIKNIPNWAKAGYQSRKEALDGIIEFMKKREDLFAGLGLSQLAVPKRKKKGKE